MNMKKLALTLALLISLAIGAFAGPYTSLIATESAAVTMKKTEKEKVPRSECEECNGTGKVKGGDGVTIVWRECDNCYDDTPGGEPKCKCNDDCKCSDCPNCDCPDCECKPPQEEPKERKTRMLMFTARWCGPCQRVKKSVLPQLKRAGWDYGPEATNHIQTIDVDQNPRLQKKFGATPIPFFIMVRDGKPIIRGGKPVGRVGYTPASQLSELFNGVFKKKKAPTQNRQRTRMTPGQLRTWCKTYTGPPAYVQGMTYLYHLTDSTAKDHHEGGPFQAWQLQGLTLAELQKIHGGQHAGVLTPKGPIK